MPRYAPPPVGRASPPSPPVEPARSRYPIPDDLPPGRVIERRTPDRRSHGWLADRSWRPREERRWDARPSRPGAVPPPSLLPDGSVGSEGLVGSDGSIGSEGSVGSAGSAGSAAEDTVARSTAAYVLRFSTGERSRVDGAGLLGRRPTPEPGERFDHVVTVTDPGRSVSKTHLEFGVEDGRLWIADRYSGNGTVIVDPGRRPVVCEPGRRYRVDRGGRVEIGEVAFEVS